MGTTASQLIFSFVFSCLPRADSDSPGTRGKEAQSLQLPA